ncbi:MAG: KOW motif-containing protein [Candidatus Hatepunaea meridiana]|nr:KOW motif-containing protein [Candidatus Hatepunaea meridiana]
MSTRKKQIGDRVMITAGQNKDKVGIIVDKERRGWTIKLEDATRVTASFPMVALIEATTQAEQAGREQQQETAEAESLNAEVEASHEADPTTQSEAEPTTETPKGGVDVAKMTVKQLQALAKQRSIGIARTKPDFLRIIKEKNPDEDLERLKGKVLFERISELHISRLRTKADLVRLLQA